MFTQPCCPALPPLSGSPLTAAKAACCLKVKIVPQVGVLPKAEAASSLLSCCQISLLYFSLTFFFPSISCFLPGFYLTAFHFSVLLEVNFELFLFLPHLPSDSSSQVRNLLCDRNEGVYLLL